MAFKSDIALILALTAGTALWIEHGHRAVIDAPAPSGSAAAVCPDRDDAPYGEGCLALLLGNNRQSEKLAIDSTARPRPPIDSSAALVCSGRDAPESAACLAFLRDAFGLTPRFPPGSGAR